MGAAVAFLAEALRELAAREPRATVALLARHPEQADRYYEGLRRAEVPSLRRVRAQEFAFRPGVEVTDVRQVKGLEFDYVVMLDANDSQLRPRRRVPPPVPHRRHARRLAALVDGHRRAEPAGAGGIGGRVTWRGQAVASQSRGLGQVPRLSGVLRTSGVLRARVLPG